MIRGTKKLLTNREPETKSPVNLDVRASIHNRFDFEVVDAITGEVKQRAQAENVICNGLWTRLLTPLSNNLQAYFLYVHYGTGTGTPAATDTSLFTFSGYLAPIPSEDLYTFNRDQNFASIRRKCQLSESVAVGQTISEIGIAYSTASSSLCTHAMLQDMNGNAITISKTDTDIVNIYSTVFVHWSATQYDNGYIRLDPLMESPYQDQSDQTLFDGILLWLIGWKYVNQLPAYQKAWPGSGYNDRLYYFQYGASKNNMATKLESMTGGMTMTCDLPNKKFVYTMTRIPIANCNIDGGISVIGIGRWDFRSCSAQLLPDITLFVGGTWYPGTEITGEAIGTGDGSTCDFQTDYVMVSDAVIKVDGATATNVTVDDNIPANLTDMGHNFKRLSYCVSENTSDSSWKYDSMACRLDSDPTRSYDVYVYGPATKAVYYNPFYDLGIASFKVRGYAQVGVSVSNDNETYVEILSASENASKSSGAIISVPVEYQHYKYWKLEGSIDGNMNGIYQMTCCRTDAKNIHFTTPPAAGAVITADYFTKTITKDTNHVLDLTVTVQLGEYTE